MTVDPDHDPHRHAVAPGEVAQPPVPFAVTAGGVPTETERAAIGRALARLITAARAEAASTAGVVAAAGIAGGGAGTGTGRVPAWTRAALAEATTSVTITSPIELPS